VLVERPVGGEESDGVQGDSATLLLVRALVLVLVLVLVVGPAPRRSERRRRDHSDSANCEPVITASPSWVCRLVVVESGLASVLSLRREAFLERLRSSSAASLFRKAWMRSLSLSCCELVGDDVNMLSPRAGRLRAVAHRCAVARRCAPLRDV
jgi:hypothetical protein